MESVNIHKTASSQNIFFSSQGPFLLSSFILGLALLVLIGENIWWSLTKKLNSSVEDYEAKISQKKKKVAFNGYSHEDNFQMLRQ